MNEISIAQISRRLLPLCILLVPLSTTLYSQGPCGGKPCPVIRINPTNAARTPRPRPPKRDPSQPPTRPPRVETAVPTCEDSELVVVCGMPGCEIILNGKDRNVTDDLGGITFQVAGNRPYKVKVTKPGYEPFEETVRKLDCDDQREVNARLRALPVNLRLRTNPADCDIYIDGQKQPLRSDSQGHFSYQMSKPTMLIEARKKGFLSATKNILLKPELAAQEILLDLDPISASLKLSANIESARVSIDNIRGSRSLGDRIMLPPGAHTLTIEALGYVPIKLELTVGPDESVKREVTLERLPLSGLQSQALSLFATRAYDDVIKLCSYIREADRGNAVAHRLMGLIYLDRGDFSNAVSELDKALAAGESFALPVRRHAGEKFELSKGHDACNAQLIIGKNEVEFKSTRSPADNFKVNYAQIQVSGIQIKSSVAAYLSTKVLVNGKKRDFNFYSFDRELSQIGRPYLEMIQRLLRSH